MKKRILSLMTVTVLLFSLLLSGCSSNKAQDTANAMCSLIFKCKMEDGDKFGVSESDEKELIEQYEDAIKDQFKQNLSMVGYVPTDSELDSVCDAYKEALSKISYESKEVSKSGDQAEVEISTSLIDMKDVDEKAALAAFDETETTEYSTIDEGNEKYAKVYIEKIVESLKNAEPSSDKSSKTFKFKKQDKFWVPEDSSEFGFKLVRLATSSSDADINVNEDIASPTESAEALWNLVIKQDSSSMDKLGYSEALGKRIIKNIQKNDFDTFKSEFEQMNFNISDEQVQKIVDSLEKSIAKTTVRFEEASKTDTTAQVKVYATSINLDKIVQNTVDTTQSQAIASGMTEQDKILELYFSNLISGIQNAEISSNENNQTFQFSKVGDVWMPSDTVGFTAGIGELSMK